MIKKRSTNAENNKEKAKNQMEAWQVKKEEKINQMSEDEIVVELKAKGLLTFGTKGERVDRLKKHYGITSKEGSGKGKSMNEIEKIKQQRESRRAEISKMRKEKQQREIENEAMGKLGDVEFEKMIEEEKYNVHMLADHQSADDMKLCVCVRKRPIFKKELSSGENDCLSVANPEIKVFESKFKVDGITKYIEKHNFTFDNTFNENEDTKDVYDYSVKGAIEELFNTRMVTLIAYGQTGSGKTFTMQGIQELVVSQLFQLKNKDKRQTQIFISFFEIYGGRCYDLLNDKTKVQVLEDQNNTVVVQGLTEQFVGTKDEMLDTINYAFEQRTTHCTTSNDTSSRSHALCQIIVKDQKEEIMGKLTVVDLAGSERAQDTQSNNRQRRLEGAEINKSLLALKECIRAMDTGNGHVPFRASKLTLALRDAFVGKGFINKVIMFACICPGSSSADHTLNTLRYADRLKGKKNTQQYNYPQDGRKQSENLLPSSKDIQNVKEDSKNKDDPKPKEIQKNKEITPPKPIIPVKEDVKRIMTKPSNAINPVQKGREKLFRHNSNNNSDYKEDLSISDKNVEHDKKKEHTKWKKPKEEIKFNKNNSPKNLKNQPSNTNHENRSKKQKPVEESMPSSNQEHRTKYREDFDMMKQTIKQEQNDPKTNKTDEFFNFHEKVADIIDLHDDMLALHLNIIREDAQLLTKESEVISKAQSELVDYEIDAYVQDVEDIVKKKLYLYKNLSTKVKEFKKALKEEEEISSQIRGTMYY